MNIYLFCIFYIIANQIAAGFCLYGRQQNKSNHVFNTVHTDAAEQPLYSEQIIHLNQIKSLQNLLDCSALPSNT